MYRETQGERNTHLRAHTYVQIYTLLTTATVYGKKEIKVIIKTFVKVPL